MPQFIAPDSVIAKHCAGYLREGRIVFLRERIIALHCARIVRYHVNPYFLPGKPSKAMGHLVIS